MPGAFIGWIGIAAELRSYDVDVKATAVLVAVMVAVLLVNVAIFLAMRKKSAAKRRETPPDDERG